jgi:hypothetical protein
MSGTSEILSVIAGGTKRDRIEDPKGPVLESRPLMIEESDAVASVLSDAQTFANNATAPLGLAHILYALTRNPLSRLGLTKCHVDLEKLSKLLYAQVFPHETAQIGVQRRDRYDVIVLRLRAARIAANDLRDATDTGDLLQAFGEISQEQKANATPLWAALRECWEPAKYVDPSQLVRETAQEVVRKYDAERSVIEKKLDTLIELTRSTRWFSFRR